MARKTNKNHIVQDKWDLVCEENRQLLGEFVSYCESAQKKESTIYNYISDIKIFFVWNLEFNKNQPFYAVTKRVLTNYQTHMIKVWKLSPPRMARLKSSLSSLSDYCEQMLEEELPEWKGFRNIVNRIPKIIKGEPRREKTVLNFEEIKTLYLDELVSREKYQYACLIALAIYGGARKSELGRYKVSYFSDANIAYGCWYRTPEKIECKGRGDHRLHKYTLKKEFDYYLDLWLQERTRLGIDSEWLFVNQKGEQATDKTINAWFKYINNIQPHINLYAHALRHTFVTHLKTLGLPDDVVIEVMGWAKGSGNTMVSIYSDISADENMSKFFSEDGIVIPEK